MKETYICVVDERRRVVKEGRVGSEPKTIAGDVRRSGSRRAAGGLSRRADLKAATSAMPAEPNQVDARSID